MFYTRSHGSILSIRFQLGGRCDMRPARLYVIQLSGILNKISILVMQSRACKVPYSTFVHVFDKKIIY